AAASSTRWRRADRRCAARGGRRDLAARASLLKEAVRADLVQLAGHRSLVLALTGVRLKALERLHIAQRVVSVVGLDRREVHEADTVVQLERRVAKTRGGGVLELCIDRPHQGLILLR